MVCRYRLYNCVFMSYATLGPIVASVCPSGWPQEAKQSPVTAGRPTGRRGSAIGHGASDYGKQQNTGNQ